LTESTGTTGNHSKYINPFPVEIIEIVDGYAGWSFTSWALNQPQTALERATFVLFKEPNYVFSQDTRIKAEHLIWVQAASYLQLQNYSACLQKIQILAPSFSPDLNDPNIEDALLIKLEELGSAV
jgi:hypothetical protein